MADLQQLLVVDFASFNDQEASQDSSDIRLPDVLTAQAFTSDGPLVVDKAGASYEVRGLHPNPATTDSDTAVLYDTSLAPSVEEVSFIRMRAFGDSADFRAAPATRITADGIGCYAAELIWNTSVFDLEICRYDATTGTRNVLGTAAGVLSSPGTDRFYGIGIKAEGTSGTITLRAYVVLLYQLGGASPTGQFDLNNLDASQSATLTATDTSGSMHTAGAHGIKFKPATLSAIEIQRVVSQWGLFMDISSTRPDAPTVISATGTGGQKLTAVISGFSDSDPLDSHASTRWLLYEDIGGSVGARYSAPLVDTGFLTGNKLTYTFQDLAPDLSYAVRAQVRDNDGDVSGFGDRLARSGDAHNGMLTSVHLFETVSAANWRKPLALQTHEPGLPANGATFTLRRRAPGASESDPRMVRFATVPTGQYRRFAWRDLRYTGDSPEPLYVQLMATMAFVKWPDASGLRIGVRTTAADADGYYLGKASSGSNWVYTLYHRTLDAGGAPATGSTGGPWTETTLTTATVAKAKVGSDNGERVIFGHLRSAAGVGTLLVYVNGKLIGAHSPANGGGADVGHQWHAFQIDDTNGSFEIYQYGVVGPVGSWIPTPNLTVLPNQRETGRAAHSPGPYMDPWDLGNANIWYQDSGSWKLASDSSGADAYLTYWAPNFTTYDMSVKAAITGNNGVVARYADSENYCEAVISGSGGTRTLTFNAVIGGVTLNTTSASISYVAGQDVTLQVADSISPVTVAPLGGGAPALLVRVFYNDTMVIPSSGNVHVVYNATALATGRPGIKRASAVTSTTETVASSFVVSPGVESIAPDKPTAQEPTGLATVKVSVTLSSNGFIDGDGDSHAASQWQLATYPAGSFASPLFDSGQDASNLTSITVLPLIGTWSASIEGLDAATQYQYRVRHKDSSGIWSPWSDAYVFTTGSPSATTSVAQVPATYPASPPPSDASYRRVMGFNTMISQFENGNEQRRSKSTSGRRIFELRYDPLEAGEMDTLWDFFTGTAFGALNVFNWVNPVTGEIILCRFRDDQMSREVFEATLERTGITLVEVLRI